MCESEIIGKFYSLGDAGFFSSCKTFHNGARWQKYHGMEIFAYRIG